MPTRLLLSSIWSCLLTCSFVACQASAAGPLCAATATPSCECQSGNQCRAECGDELWIVSSRNVSCDCSCKADPCGLQVYRYRPGCGRWDIDRATSLCELSAVPFAATTIYIHGNRIEPDEVEAGALQAFEGLTGFGGPPTRLIFWSWPSDKIRGQFRDVRSKIARADCEAYLLAQFMGQYQMAEPLVVVGYSLGARIATGALHLAAGGCLEPSGLSLDRPLELARRPNVSLVAPAIADDSLLPWGNYGLASAAADRFQILYNSMDPVLRRYWLLDRKSRPRALGYSGLACGGESCRFEQFDTRNPIGRTHNYRRYFESPETLELLRSQIRAAASL